MVGNGGRRDVVLDVEAAFLKRSVRRSRQAGEGGGGGASLGVGDELLFGGFRTYSGRTLDRDWRSETNSFLFGGYLFATANGSAHVVF